MPLTLDLSAPVIMGILNVTPDSFSDGGKFTQLDIALRHAESMLQNGAKILDVGGESTRPGAPEVQCQEELDRVIPIIEEIRTRFDTIISIDTSKPAVMRDAVSAGADMINDVRALQNEGAMEVASNLGVPVCLMHMQGLPRTMQSSPSYQNVVDDVYSFFESQMVKCVDAGILPHNILLDPGFGFGKTVAHNYELLANLKRFKQLSAPLLIGLSRKSMIGAKVDNLTETNDRLIGSVTAASIAAMNGAQILRVHDVSETAQALSIVNAIKNGENCERT